METINTYQEIAKYLEKEKLSTDDAVITFDEDEVRITAGADNMICGYMLKRIYVAAGVFKKNYFVHLSIDNKAEVIIYE